MIAAWQDIVRKEIEAGTGAGIGMSVDSTGLRTGLRIWFSDLEETQGPIVDLKPHGLRGYRATLGFGSFAGAVVRQMQGASEEDVRLARALVASISPEVELECSGQDLTAWKINGGSFKLTAVVRRTEEPSDEAVMQVSRNVIVPLMAAMAELIGYDVIETEDAEDYTLEGALLLSTVRRRERNPRNRLLCIRLHGEQCVFCGLVPRNFFGDAGDIIEVHHLQALSLLEVPRAYDPAIDLVPLCPNCHRAVHTRRPVPFGLDELRILVHQHGGKEDET